MEVLAAEFLPQDKQLFLLLADGDCNIHVLEFNPEGMLLPSLPISRRN